SVSLQNHFEAPGGVVRALLRALRPHQWSKNLLVLVPVLAAHISLAPTLLGAALLAFMAFSLAASSAYVLNDLLDLEADRRHPRKRLRPFASGALALGHGFWLAPALLGASVAIGLHLPPEFMLILGTYLMLTLAYSFCLKRIVLLDAITLSGLYGVRILAGSAAVGVAVSSSMLAFALFIFLSLAMLKRFTELDAARSPDGRVVKLRAYEGEDRLLLLALGGASGYLSVAVLAQYINSETARSLYSTPEVMWLACPLLLYWISHAWLLAHRGQMHDDPVVFAATNRTSQCIIGLVFLTLLCAL
ncbi:MAG: UbiA family prenyltransferase, partial [Gammaproteobacteria bacterium]|nr:UbiA family prenyltransferase [Gammaproteobacteria bacterium]